MLVEEEEWLGLNVRSRRLKSANQKSLNAVNAVASLPISEGAEVSCEFAVFHRGLVRSVVNSEIF